MSFFEERRFSNWFIIIASTIIVGLFVWNITIFFDRIKKEEQDKMEIWVSAYSEIISNTIDDNFSSISVEILEKNTTTPMIVYSLKEQSYDTRNISLKKVDSEEEIQALIEQFKSQYEPIEITYNRELYSILYYGNSDLLNRLKYFPAIIILVVLLFVGIIYYFYSTSKSNEQSKLWAGMAKETAHQIGTPLSSLVGWTEILKVENIKASYVQEMQKDIDRLQTITDRFSKIGSLPTLSKTDIVDATQQSFEYLKDRSSKLIIYSIQLPSEKIYVQLNEQLFSWTIENLVKNAIDALRGKGEIQLEIIQDQKWVRLLISDTGKGIPKGSYKKIFTPGYTTKKRGWGLGLSLAKRIVEDYHNGKIRVQKSESGKGSTFEIRLKKADA